MNGVPQGIRTLPAFLSAANEVCSEELDTWPVVHRHLVSRTRPLGPGREAWRVTMVAVIQESQEDGDEEPSLAIALLSVASDDEPDERTGLLPLAVTFLGEGEAEAINQAARVAWRKED